MELYGQEYRLVRGRLWQVNPLNAPLVDALRSQGLSTVTACWWIMRRTTILGGGERRYEKFRKLLGED